MTITSLLYHKLGLIGSTNNGEIVLYSKDSLKSYQTHQGSITCLRSSSDGSLLFTGTQDGSIFIFKLEENTQTESPYYGSQETNNGAYIKDDSLTETVLIRRSHINKLTAQIAQYKNEYKEMKNSTQREVRAREDAFERKKKDLKNTHLGHMQLQEYRLNELSNTKASSEKYYINQLHLLGKKHAEQVDYLENKYESQFDSNKQKKKGLTYEMLDIADNSQKESRKLNQHYAETSKELKDAFLQAYNKTLQIAHSEKEKHGGLASDYSSSLNNNEDHHEVEILNHQQNYLQQIELLDEEFSQLRKSEEKYLAKTESLRNKIRSRDSKLQKHKIEIKQKQKIAVHLEEHIVLLQQTIKKKEERIIYKEGYLYEKVSYIQEIQQKNQNALLRNEQVNQTLQSKIAESNVILSKIDAAGSDIANYIKRSTKLILQLNTLNSRIQFQKQDTKSYQQALKTVENTVRSLLTHIVHVVDNLEPSKWANKLKEIYRNFVLDQTSSVQGTNMLNSLKNQLEHLEHSSQSQKHFILKFTNEERSRMRKKHQENAFLIQEINKLKSLNKTEELYIRNYSQETAILKSKLKSTPQKLTSKVPARTLPSIKDKCKLLDLEKQIDEIREKNTALRIEIFNSRKSIIDVYRTNQFK